MVWYDMTMLSRLGIALYQEVVDTRCEEVVSICTFLSRESAATESWVRYAKDDIYNLFILAQALDPVLRILNDVHNSLFDVDQVTSAAVLH